MRIGIFADSHDHLHHMRLAVNRFHQKQCDYAILAGDLVSTIVVPSLHSLECPLIGCFGDNEGNRLGIQSRLSIVSKLFGEPPVFFQADDGTRFVISHMERQLRDNRELFDVTIYGYTH